MTDDEIKALLDGATPGPWVSLSNNQVWRNCGQRSLLDCVATAEATFSYVDGKRICTGAVDANARLIALSPSLAAALLVAEKALREARDELDAYYLAEYGSDHPYHVRKLSVAKDGNPARAAISEIAKLTGGGE